MKIPANWPGFLHLYPKNFVLPPQQPNNTGCGGDLQLFGIGNVRLVNRSLNLHVPNPL